jgi:hypothetical protein
MRYGRGTNGDAEGVGPAARRGKRCSEAAPAGGERRLKRGEAPQVSRRLPGAVSVGRHSARSFDCARVDHVENFAARTMDPTTRATRTTFS